MSETYKSSGVDIIAGENTVSRIKDYTRFTFNSNVLTDIGHFGGMFKFDSDKYKEPVLVSSMDGVGSKLKVAIELGKHDTIGQDLVNHCVNDIAVCGAEPLFFLDYIYLVTILILEKLHIKLPFLCPPCNSLILYSYGELNKLNPP